MQAAAQLTTWPVGAVAAGIVRSGGELAGAYGDLSVRFRLASVTKLLTAYAVLVAVEEGAVELAEAAGPPGSTVAHLLAHASGLAPDDRRAVVPPGTRRIYSNAGYDLLGRHVQQRTGIAFADYLAEAVLEPLGMSATELAGSPAAGAVASLTDLARFAADLLDPRVLARQTLDQATTVAFPGLVGVLPGFGRQEPNDWGLGFELRDSKQPHWTGTRNSPRTFGHFGRSGTFVWVDPDAGLACVCLTDRTFGPWAAQRWPQFSDAVLTEFAG